MSPPGGAECNVSQHPTQRRGRGGAVGKLHVSSCNSTRCSDAVWQEKSLHANLHETRLDFLGALSAFVARPPKLRNVDASGWLLDYSRGDEPGE